MSHGRATTDIMLAGVFLALAVIWAAVIFSFSAQDADRSASLSGKVADAIIENLHVETPHSKLEHYIRKCAHFTEYGIFASLVFASAAFFLKSLGKSPYTALIFSTPVTLIYAASDEYHQRFVSGRSGEIKDVLIDTSGGLAAGLLICLIIYLIRRKNTQG